MNTREMLNPSYEPQTKSRYFSFHCYGKIFLFMAYTFYMTATETSNLLYASPLENTFGTTKLHFQEDTVTKPVLATNNADTAREYILVPGESSAEKIRKNLFVKADADKTEYYIGEPVIVTYKLYSRLVAKSKISKQPALNGFSVYDMVEFVSNVESTELFEKRPFKVHVLRKAQLIPLQAGTMLLDPIEVDNTVHFVKTKSAPASNSSSLQDLMNQLSKEESAPSADVAVKIQSSPVKIVVKPFPEINRPADFSGAVGRFTIKAIITTQKLSVNDAGVLKVEIKGRGNVSLIDAPIIAWPPEIDTLETRINEQINKFVAPLTGVKTFEYVFTPLKAGTYKIPPVSFSFFNAASRSYQTIHTQPNVFQVAASNKPPIKKEIADSSSSPAKNGHAGNVIINYLKSRLAWVSTVTALLILIIYLWRKTRRLQKKQEPESVPVIKPESKGEDPITKEQEIEQAADVFEESRMLLEREDYKRFYRELNNVLWNEISKRLKLPLSELNKQNIVLALKHKGWTDEMTLQLESVLVKCERNIYLSDYHQETDAALVFQKAVKIVAQLKNV